MLRTSYVCDVSCVGFFGGGTIQWCPMSNTFIASYENSLSFICDLNVTVKKQQPLLANAELNDARSTEQFLRSFRTPTHPTFLPLGGEDGFCLTDGLLTFVASADATYLVTAGRSLILRSWRITLPSSLTATQNIFHAASPHCTVEQIGNTLKMHQEASWKGPLSYVSVLALQESVHNVAAGTIDGTLNVYQVKDGVCCNSFHQHSSRIGTLKFHPKIPSLLISGSDDGALHIWNLDNSSCIAKCNNHLGSITCIEFALLSSEKISLGVLMTSGRDRIVNLWNLDALLHISTSKDNSDCATKCVYLSKDYERSSIERNISACLSSKKAPFKKELTTVRLKNSMNILYPMQQVATNEEVESILCLPASSVLMEQRITDAEIRKRNSSDVKKRRIYECSTENSNSLSWVIITAGESGYIRIWNPINKRMLKEIACLHGSNGLITNLFQIGNRYLASVGIDYCARFWSLPEFNFQHCILGKVDDVINCQFIPQCEHLESCVQSRACKLYKDENWSNTTRLHATLNHNSVKKTSKSSSKRCALLCGDERTYIYELEKPFFAWPLIGHTDIVLCCDVSPSGDWILTGSKDQTIRLWRVADYVCCAILKGHCGSVTAVAFQKQFEKRRNYTELDFSTSKSFERLFLVSTAQDLSLKVWEISLVCFNTLLSLKDVSESCQTIEKSSHSVNAHAKDVNAICIAAKNRMIATASQDKLIKLWTFPDLKLLGICQGHQRGVWSVHFSQVEKVIVSASADTTIKLWNLQDFSCLKTLQGHTAAVLQAMFLSGGVQVISCSADGTIKLWNIRTSECCETLEMHNEKVWSLDCNEHYILSGGANGSLILWRDNSSAVEAEKMQQKQKFAIQDTQIQQLILNKKFTEALTLSLEFNRPAQSRQLFESISQQRMLQSVDKKLKTQGRENGTTQLLLNTHPKSISVSEVKMESASANEMYKLFLEDTEIAKWLSSLSKKNVHRLFEFIVRWNSVSKHASLANSLMSNLLNLFRPEELYEIEGFFQFLTSYLAFSSRHENRLQVLIQESFLLDLVLGNATAATFLSETEAKFSFNDFSHGDVKRNRMLSHSFLLS